MVGKERSVKNAAIERLGHLRPAPLVALLALLTLVPLLVLAMLSLRLANDAVEKEVKAGLATSAEVSAALLSREMTYLAALVDSHAQRRSLARALAAGRTDGGPARSSLDELARRPEIVLAFVADARGRLLEVQPSAPELVGKDFSFRDWYEGVTRTGDPYISSAYTSTAPGRPEVVAAAAPVRAPGAGDDGPVVGILVAAYGLESLQDFADGVARRQEVDLTVTDNKGALLASPGAAPSRILSRHEAPWLADALAGRSGVVEHDGPEGTILSAFAPVAGSGWTVTADVPAATALAQIATLRAAVLPLVGLLALVLAAGLAMLYLALRAQRRIQSALRAREAEVSAVIEAAEDAFVSMGPDGFIRGWNRRAEEVFGWSRAEALGRCLGDTIVPPAYRDAHRDGLTRLLETGESVLLHKRIEIEGLHRDGHVFPIELVIWPVDVDGQPRFNAFVHDITERKRLEATRSHLAAIIESSDDAIVSIDLDGSIISWNKGAEALYGYTASEVAGRSLALLAPPERVTEMEGYIAKARRNSGVERFRTERVTKDGRRVPVALTMSPIKEADGTVIATSEIAHDITARVRAEKEMKTAETQALEASRMKSEFLANMSHEIRTPMNGIIGSTDLLLTTELSPEQQEFVRTIQASGDALLSLINDILDFSKIEAGRIELEEVSFDLRVAIDDSVDLLAESAHGKGLEIATLTQPNAPAGVLGDPGRLRQILVNLVGNAVKFTEQGEVVVRAALDDESDGLCCVRFEVSDTGMGIAPEHQERLFDSFTQADASTTRRYGGTGLGLAISKQLVELMGGEIGVESELGEGSTFWFTVELTRSPEAQVAVPHEEASLAGLRVLIVDDHPTNRAMLELNVASWGMQSTTASGGRQALRLLHEAVEENTPFAIVLLDFNMPGMNGITLARAIRRDSALQDVRLVLLTSSVERGASVAQDAGLDAFLTKPVRHVALHDTLMAIVGSQPAGARPSIVTGYSLSEAKARRRAHILVAEDNEVSQKVAARMLDKLGYRVDVASNGAEAVDAVGRTDYAAVLMDCQMPEVDGYEATRRIRRLGGRAAEVPIIAMTASAMKRDQENARAAGMDDYLPKPVKAQALAATLERWTNGEEGEMSQGRSRERPEAGAAVDGAVLASLRELESASDVGHDGLVGQFLGSAAASLDKLREAVARADGGDIAFVAHSLKGIVGTLGARGLAERCAELDEAAKDGDVESAPALLAEIEREFDRVCLEIDADSSARARSASNRDA